MNREETDRDIVREQFFKLRSLENKFKYINIVNDYHENKNRIGDVSERVRYGTYNDVYDHMIDNDQFTILMKDECMITMEYEFDVNNAIMSHTLSFIPNYKKDIGTVVDEENIKREDAEIKEPIRNMRISNYIRIDYDEEGKKEFFHSLIHMHIGVFKETFRIPVENCIYPLDFVYFILKYIYHEESPELKELEFDIVRKCYLTEDERKKLKISFGEIK